MKRLFAVVVVLVAMSAAAEEQSVEQQAAPPAPPAVKRVSGHLGIVTPLVTARASGVSSIANGFVFGVTSGLGLNIIGPLNFDAELVTLIDTANRVVDIVIHPGLLVSLPLGFTTGVRGAWETQGAWGFTPLLNKGFKVGSNVLYVEAAFPVRWAMQPASTAAFTFALHAGIGF
ncbi:MAG: hypothetical protein QM817_21660 [Archangium sp.]